MWSTCIKLVSISSDYDIYYIILSLIETRPSKVKKDCAFILLWLHVNPYCFRLVRLIENVIYYLQGLGTDCKYYMESVHIVEILETIEELPLNVNITVAAKKEALQVYRYLQVRLLLNIVIMSL